jgi:hypothetical protein
MDSWSYLINLTLIGNAVYMSMDIPDAFLAVRNPCALFHIRSPYRFTALETFQLLAMGASQSRVICNFHRCLDVRWPFFNLTF